MSRKRTRSDIHSVNRLTMKICPLAEIMLVYGTFVYYRQQNRKIVMRKNAQST